MAVQTIPNNHQGILPVTFNTMVFLISQCAITRATMIRLTLAISTQDNTAAPEEFLMNIECKMRQAEVKSGDLKNTQVTLIRKKVQRARKKLVRFFGCVVSGGKYPSGFLNSGANELLILSLIHISEPTRRTP